MNTFARFDENPSMTLEDIKETKRYGRLDTRTQGRTHRQRENSIPTTNKVCGGYNKVGPGDHVIKVFQCTYLSGRGQTVSSLAATPRA